MQNKFNVIIVGTSFSASFFLHRYLERAPPEARVLVLERGQLTSHKEQLADKRAALDARSQAAFVNRTPEKEWAFLHMFGGNSNCWTGSTPRMLPDDFRLRSRFGVGADWPLSYQELEPYYCDAEEIMAIAGPAADASPFSRSRPYPLPPHRTTAVDQLFKNAFPDQLFAVPAARPTQATANRSPCCASMACYLCPVDAKFTILNELYALYRDPRVTLELGATVQAVDVHAGTLAKGVRYSSEGAERSAEGELVVLGANGLFNPHVLLRSGITHPELGKGLGEQVGTWVILYLDGVDNYGGSSIITSHWYGLHEAATRSERAAALVELSNVPQLRMERGKWRQVAHMRVIYEDLREPANTVSLNKDEPTKPEAFYVGPSAYARRGLDSLHSELTRRFAGLPIKDIFVRPKPLPTEYHIQGTVVMGHDPRTSVVDSFSVHHTVRNLVVLGSSNFPTMATANPTLTLSALALRTADHLTGAT